MRFRVIALLLTLTLGLLAAPLPAEAQKAGKVYRIGWLSPGSTSSGPVYREAFVQQLHELGWVEGQNLTIQSRYAEGRLERLPDLGRELVRLRPDVMLTISTPGLRATRNATRTIPIVFTW